MASAKRGRRNAFAESGRSETVRELYAAAEEAAQQPQTSGQGKPGHAGRIGIDQAGRTKATYDIAEEIQVMIREIAATEDCHISDIVEAALRLFIAKYKANQVDLTPYKVPTRSLKAVWRLELPTEIDFFLD